MKCIIVDDEEMAIKVLENHIGKIGSLEIVATHTNAIDAFETLNKTQVDLLFLDIQMPKLTGFGLLKTLPRHPHVIITTAHREYALESYDFAVTDYLLKPISFERLLRAVGKVQELAVQTPSSSSSPPASTEPSFIYIRCDRRQIKVYLEDILYIESLRNHVRIFTTEQDYTTLTSISEMAEKLPACNFLRIHRSYIVSLPKVQEFSSTHLRVGKVSLSIGNLYKKEVRRRLDEGVI